MSHARFAHSLGAMHLAGEMFKSGFANALPDVVAKFGSAIHVVHEKTVVDIHKEKNSYFSYSEEPLPLPSTKQLCEISSAYRFAQSLTQAEDDIKRERIEQGLVLAYQALRVATLVHDLGHPPFSHATEDSITEVGAETLARHLDKTFEGTPSSAWKSYRDAVLSSADAQPLHERLTVLLFDELTKQLLEGFVKKHHTPDAMVKAKYVFMRQTLLVAQLLLLSEKNEAFVSLISGGSQLRARENEGRLEEIYGDELGACRNAVRCLHDIKDSDFDADRLDYVSRDLMQAGVKSSGLRLGRLLETMTVVDCSTDPSPFEPRLLCSVKALRSLEEFYQDRLELYRTVLYHHHVVKTDLLLTLCVKCLLEETVVAPEPPVAVPGPPAVNKITLATAADSAALYWLIFSPPDSFGSGARQLLYALWNDGWLISLLQRRYNSLVVANSDRAIRPSKEDIVFEARLCELLAGKKTYKSLVKRQEDVLVIWASFQTKLAALCKDGLLATIGAWIVALEIAAVNSDRVKVRLGQAKKILEVVKTAIAAGNQHPSDSANLLPFADRGELFDKKGVRTLKVAAASVMQQPNQHAGYLNDFLVAYKPQKTSKGSLLIAADDKSAKELRNYSSSEQQLLLAANSMPRIFAYALFAEDELGEVDFSKRKAALLDQLGHAFAVAIGQILTDEFMSLEAFAST